jgi:hypothetical protein
MIKLTTNNAELMLDAGLLQAQMHTGKWWSLRRNGKTQRWKRSPQRFRVPCKAGGAFGPSFDLTESTFDSPHIRIEPGLMQHAADIETQIEARRVARAFAELPD